MARKQLINRSDVNIYPVLDTIFATEIEDTNFKNSGGTNKKQGDINQDFNTRIDNIEQIFDSSGKIISSVLPSYVDDVLSFDKVITNEEATSAGYSFIKSTSIPNAGYIIYWPTYGFVGATGADQTVFYGNWATYKGDADNAAERFGDVRSSAGVLASKGKIYISAKNQIYRYSGSDMVSLASDDTKVTSSWDLNTLKELTKGVCLTGSPIVSADARDSYNGEQLNTSIWAYGTANGGGRLFIGNTPQGISKTTALSEYSTILLNSDTASTTFSKKAQGLTDSCEVGYGQIKFTTGAGANYIISPQFISTVNDNLYKVQVDAQPTAVNMPITFATNVNKNTLWKNENISITVSNNTTQGQSKIWVKDNINARVLVSNNTIGRGIMLNANKAKNPEILIGNVANGEMPTPEVIITEAALTTLAAIQAKIDAGYELVFVKNS